MKRMQCELCGGTDIVKDGDFFVCQSCGTKYTAENARKMMVEGVVQVEGTVKTDRSEDIDKFLSLSNEALSSNNFANAEKYANRVLEIDPKNREAWHIKAKAIDWQSSITNDRFVESVRSYKHYVELLTNEIESKQSVEITAEALLLAKEINEGARAEVDLFCKPFANKWSQANLITVMLKPHVDIRASLLEPLLEQLETSNEDAGYRMIAQQIRDTFIPAIYRYSGKAVFEAAVSGSQAILSAWEKLLPFEYWTGSGNPDYSNETKQFEIVISTIDNAIAALEISISLESDNSLLRLDDETYIGNLITVRQEIIKLHKNAINLRSRRTYHDQYGSHSGGNDGFFLAESAVDLRNERIAEQKSKIESLNEQLEEYRKKELELFWESHQDLKAEHEANIQKLEQQIGEIQLEIESEQIELNKCGLFDLKRKKEIKAKLCKLEDKLKSLRGEKECYEEDLHSPDNLEFLKLIDDEQEDE